jgi:hypothetical protein
LCSLAAGFQIACCPPLQLGDQRAVVGRDRERDPVVIAQRIEVDAREVERAVIHAARREHHPCAVTLEVGEQPIGRAGIAREEHDHTVLDRDATEPVPRDRRLRDVCGRATTTRALEVGVELFSDPAVDRRQPCVIGRTVPVAAPRRTDQQLVGTTRTVCEAGVGPRGRLARAVVVLAGQIEVLAGA